MMPMEIEGSRFDKKSISFVTGRSSDWDELAKDAVAFANAKGGRLAIGIEDDADLPPRGLAQGRHVPVLREGPDRVEVVIRRLILNAEAIDLIVKADAVFQLSQRERICFGLIAQHDSATARDLASVLELPGVHSLRPWLGRILELGLVASSGRTKATRYFIPPDLLGKLNVAAATDLRRIEPRRLKALVVEDLQRYPGSSIGAIQERVGVEIPRPQIKRALEQLIEEGRVHPSGAKRGRRYRIAG